MASLLVVNDFDLKEDHKRAYSRIGAADAHGSGIGWPVARLSD
jgi:hypothetical protein